MSRHGWFVFFILIALISENSLLAEGPHSPQGERARDRESVTSDATSDATVAEACKDWLSPMGFKLSEAVTTNPRGGVVHYHSPKATLHITLEGAKGLVPGKVYALGKEVSDYPWNADSWSSVEVYDPKTCKATGAILMIHKRDLGIPANIVSFLKSALPGSHPEGKGPALQAVRLK